ncbi:MAG: DUF116 domain-containing protein [Candidatus Cloacimonetes bacterium]|jgi:hypothetical protein|nr:DUF116 domain-containing protein [Candidatus Cloacimonadota bacterium]MCB5287274.1 DUF116 domain-containing protein [Candidatus Cloacimonadota bacterium]MCK9185573.1 DUF116 domain-containing protein [Candidatus Cloacimonadota bacterium]MCK9585154.1 DUF116 domain-containing protein [Candidatus Cloacimonadota bacterium]MDY0229596.1 DUF116 domain-containing protein [Candidatus Cloacimonadaceae bacterium]
MKDEYLNVIKFPLLVSLSLAVIAAAFFGLVFGSYFKLGLSANETVIYSVLFSILTILVSSWVLNLISTHSKIRPRWMEIYSKWMLVHVYYNLASFLNFISFQKKQQLQESYLNFNNEIVLSAAKNIHHTNILLLLPHCLQNSKCKIRVTSDINDCASCGKCDIAELKALAKKLNVRAAVATGGSLARKIIKDTSPDVIVAVACHRDLIDGVRDAWRLPVFGVLNERPNGPCFETTVNLHTIEFAIRKFQ